MIRLRVKVKPNARSSALSQSADGAWVAKLTSPPVDGKANEELVALVAKHFGCVKAAVRIKSGGSGRMKLIEVLVAVILAAATSAAAQSRTGRTVVTRLFTGADGQSHAEDVEVAWRTATLRADLSESDSVKTSSAQFLRWPRGFVWEGHPASKRQYVIIVSGRGEVDLAEGRKIPLAPGTVLLAEDTTGKGHITRVGPDEDLVMLLVPLAQKP